MQLITNHVIIIQPAGDRGLPFHNFTAFFGRFTIHKEIFTIFTFTTFYIEMVVKISLFHNSQISQQFFVRFHNSQLILGPFLKSQIIFNSQFLNFFYLLSQFHNFLKPISQFSKTVSPPVNN